MFRRKSAGSFHTMRHDERLAVLGAILDNERFVLDGLSILASNEGFVVVGYVPTAKGFHTQLVQRTLEITGQMIDDAVALR